jgi:pantetheine-phosphate adenylyltransferase
MKKAVFPGSFDPFTTGHEAIVHRALQLFDIVCIAIGVNTDKQYMFSPEERLQRVRDIYSDESRIEVLTYSDMTVDLCHRVGAQFILRGIRNEKDFAYEQTIAAVNHTLDPSIDTVILLSDTEHRDISSTLERERLAHQHS